MLRFSLPHSPSLALSQTAAVAAQARGSTPCCRQYLQKPPQGLSLCSMNLSILSKVGHWVLSLIDFYGTWWSPYTFYTKLHEITDCHSSQSNKSPWKVACSWPKSSKVLDAPAYWSANSLRSSSRRLPSNVPWSLRHIPSRYPRPTPPPRAATGSRYIDQSSSQSPRCDRHHVDDTWQAAEITWCLQPPLLTRNHLDRWTNAPWDPHEVILASSTCGVRQGNRSWQDVLLMSSSNSVLWSVESTKGLENWGQTGYHPQNNLEISICTCVFVCICVCVWIHTLQGSALWFQTWRLAKGIACELYFLSVTIPWACGMP